MPTPERDGRVLLEPAVVLHRRPYRDTSLLLEVFTAGHGRVGLVARGVRGKRTAKAALLQPFQAVVMSWRGSGELKTLTDVESDGASAPLISEAIPAGFYLCELILRTCHRDDPHPRLFGQLKEALAGLGRSLDQSALRGFEKVLLEEIGYGLQLDRQADNGSPVLPERRYCYIAEQGVWPVEAAPRHGVEIGGAALLALARGEQGHPAWQAETKALMRAALAPVLGHRPLRSRELYRALRREPGVAA